ncbi:DUF4397 domain-containing protein [Hymenobacter sp. BT770]|uniref:DUF4397 domain-containing protein n=1 Tax=Hymenobacter sp. BT770 TaxID=2886942 RepID=UPI001D10EECC|nr:DUF4397 domain-containing protein [Hymenobacter sp. BT770]MCC3151919.1 DUF4397 domain-containing protein [Hymenobacter sp. BT770]MDO3413458.1 DUF4397 domain-containing protein [Hymenobacter sp. BT770]
METSLIFRRAFQAILPASLLLASCSKSDTPAPAPVDQGKVAFINAASHIAPTTLKFLVDNTEKASLAYGASSSYQGIQTGSHSLQITAGTQAAFTMTLAPEKDKTYTFVATPATSPSTVNGLLFPDDLTAPTTGKARIRLINLAQGVGTPLRLSQVTSTVTGPVVADVVTNVGVNSASAFTEFAPGAYALSILDNSATAGATPIAQVGDGSGSGSGTKTYEAGKIYTVVVSGTQGSLNQDQKVKAFLSQNN